MTVTQDGLERYYLTDTLLSHFLPNSPPLPFLSLSPSLLVLTALRVLRACCRFCSGSATLTVSSCRFWQECCRFRQQCRTKFRPRQSQNKLNMFNLFRRNFTINSFDIVAVFGNEVERCFDSVACCFDVVAGVDGA